MPDFFWAMFYADAGKSVFAVWMREFVEDKFYSVVDEFLQIVTKLISMGVIAFIDYLDILHFGLLEFSFFID